MSIFFSYFLASLITFAHNIPPPQLLHPTTQAKAHKIGHTHRAHHAEVHSAQ